MMLYLFAKDANQNIIRIGADCDVPSQLAEQVANFTQAGYTLAEAADYDAQIINGATKTAPPEAQSTPVNELPTQPEGEQQLA